MILLVGLGNPGLEYEGTRHNLGFDVVRKVVAHYGMPELVRKSEYNALVSEGTELVALLPQTFMNNSGVSVKKVLSKHSFDSIVVVHDDLDLPIGTARISFNRGSGGHNGVKSVSDHIGSEYIRVRMGISPVTEEGEIRKPKGEDEVDRFVLGIWKPYEKSIIEDEIERGSLLVRTIIEKGLEFAMDMYN